MFSDLWLVRWGHAFDGELRPVQSGLGKHRVPEDVLHPPAQIPQSERGVRGEQTPDQVRSASGKPDTIIYIYIYIFEKKENASARLKNNNNSRVVIRFVFCFF